MPSNAETPKVPRIEDLIESNRHYAASVHKPLPPLMTMVKNDFKTWGPHILVVACLDSRSNPYTVLGLKPFECIVIRNVAGRFATAATDITALDTLFHISQLVLLQHSNCGASHVTKGQVLDSIRAKRATITSDELAQIALRLPMVPNNDRELVEDLKAVKECTFIRKDLLDTVVGLYLDVDTGVVRIVSPDGSKI